MYVRSEMDQRVLDSIAGVMRTFRANEGLTQRQAAKLAKTTQNQIHDVENAKADIKILTIRKFALAFGYDIEISFIPIEDMNYEE